MSSCERAGGRLGDKLRRTRDFPSKSRGKRALNERSSHKHGKRSKSSSSSDSEISLPPEEIQKLKEMVRQKKAIMKELETPEEKRARRMAKKERKERRRREKLGWGKDYLGYTNEDNPFGDRHLSETFVWRKKIDDKGLSHLDGARLQTLQAQKMEENRRELENVRRRRLEREREKEEREKELEMLQREREAEYYKSWGQQEDTFHLEQAKLRSRIRIADGRAKPIDLLSKYIADQDEGAQNMTNGGDISSAIEVMEPTQFLVGLSIDDLEDLLVDIKIVYMELEKGQNVEYWRDMTVIVEDELRRLRQDEDAEGGGGRHTSVNISNSVLQSVADTLKSKTYAQLAALERQIQPKLHGGEGVDVGYWETLSQFVAAQMARTRLRERHQEHLRRKLAFLQQNQGISSASNDSNPIFPSGSGSTYNMVEQIRELQQQAVFKMQRDEGQQLEEAKKGPEDPPTLANQEEIESTPGPSTAQPEAPAVSNQPDPYDSSLYSPVLLDQSDVEIDAVLYDAQDDRAKLEYQRKDVMHTGALRKTAEEELVKRAREGVEEGDAEFSVLAPLEDQSFLWSDKYRPRKPRFFNRVHTGFVWNKYNQTHYDLDNPPPKVVQGYKFNIFYPDLIDMTKTPTYTRTPCDGEPDFEILRFIAGPPYEDIAFKIVSREWEYSYKHGFRCQFHNTIFQLWFHFKRFRYRR
ncbi:Cactin protein cactus binding domain C terminal [Echinococcus multilocularis]|uniref:Splicing factor Cactin n=1 Tax=Echinococcus multilocularis TaxID=6211 RepID=A0A068YCW4_ECHMU|nr:Cactin protein cactus binding domain C terminal [Echinococcus multilocularis]